MYNNLEVVLDKDEYLEDFDKEHKIIQKKFGFKYGTDTVLLCKFVEKNIKENTNILDIGTGNGIIPLILSKKLKNLKNYNFYAIDIQLENIKRAKKNVEINNLNNLFSFECYDVKEYKKSNFFDLIISNPPYMVEDGKKKNIDSHKSISRHETFLNLKDFISNSKRLLKPIGKLCFIHRSFRLVEIIKELDENKFSIEKIIFIYSKNKETNMMYVEAVKGKKVKLKIENYFI